METIEEKPDLIAESLSRNDPADLFKPASEYALQPLPEAFIDIQKSLRWLFRSQPAVKTFDATAFYSRRRPNLSPEDEEGLAVFNQAAFTAAESMGGLVVYYQGHILNKDFLKQTRTTEELGFIPDCLSFCIWQTRRQALSGAGVAPHRKAVARTHLWYENFGLKKYAIDATDRNNISFTEFKRNQ